VCREGQYRLERNGRTFSFSTKPGVFAADGPDPGSLLLLDAVLPALRPHQRVLDLGTGNGILGLVVAAQLPRGEMWMVDVDIRATRLAEANRIRNGIENGHVLLSDGTLDLPSRLRFDLVISNPPTHSGRRVLEELVSESFQVLKSGGSLWVVVNRLLSVRDTIQRVFGNGTQISRKGGYLVLRAEKPRNRVVKPDL